MIDHLCFERRPNGGAGTRQVEIRVEATGLNFRDVLNALGMYPGDAGPAGQRVRRATVVAVGAGVETLAVGDEVMGIGSRQLRAPTWSPTPPLVRAVPAGLTSRGGRGVPIAFLTAELRARTTSRGWSRASGC